jgi:hypothetical protein
VYFWYATDCDTLRMSCLIFSIITVYDFNVYSLQNTCGLYISSVCSNESHLQLWVKWQTCWRYFQIMCATTPKQCLNFRLWTPFISLFWHYVFAISWRNLENLWTPSIVCLCNSSIHKDLWNHPAVFYGACSSIAVLKILKIFNFH